MHELVQVALVQVSECFERVLDRFDSATLHTNGTFRKLAVDTHLSELIDEVKFSAS